MTELHATQPRTAGDSPAFKLRAWQDALPLPNGLACYLTSASMRHVARYMVREIFRDNVYWLPGFDLRPDDTVVDVGANIGVFVLWAATRVPCGRIVAIEPEPRALQCLELNIQLNELKNVAVVQAAAGRDGGTLEMVSYAGAEAITRAASLEKSFRRALKLIPGGPRRFTVPTVSLERVLEEQGVERVGFLKVDCEGGEYELLRHTRAATWQGIDRIAMEFHEYDPSQQHGELVSTLRAQGFTVRTRRSWYQEKVQKVGNLWAWRS